MLNITEGAATLNQLLVVIYKMVKEIDCSVLFRSYDSASTSPAQSPREGEEETIGGGKERGSRRGAMSGDDEDYYTHTYSSARPIIKRACMSTSPSKRGGFDHLPTQRVPPLYYFEINKY